MFSMASQNNKETNRVIDEALIKKSIQKKDVDEKERENTPFELVTELKFSYKCIIRIDNLIGFDRLTQLSLDNNRISTIENLSHLKTLQKLDLSFNRITQIGNGLEGLTNLADLSLHSNAISVLEGMDTLVNLRSLSVGKNKIAQIANLQYLRRFKKLAVLNFSGNPIPEVEYTAHFLSHIHNLQFLDRIRVDETKRMYAQERYEDTIRGLIEKEKQEEQQSIADQKRADYLSLLKEANIEGVEYLFENCMKEDTDRTVISVLPGMEEANNEYLERNAKYVEDFKTNMIELHNSRQGELENFNKIRLEEINKNVSSATALLKTFNAEMKKLNSQAKEGNATELIKEYENTRKKVKDLSDELFELEYKLSDQIEILIKEFDRKMSDLNSLIVTCTQTFFGKLRDSETFFHEKTMFTVMTDYEKHQTKELEDLTEEQISLLSDRETLQNYVNGSHDSQVSHIETLLDEMKLAESSRRDYLMSKVKNDESKRNRAKVSEVHTLQRYNEEVIETQIGYLKEKTS